MNVYERGDVRLHYIDEGSGFPLLAIPGGGLKSNFDLWRQMPFNAMEVFRDHFRVISMDQRNSCERSTGPLQIDDPWNAFADDQLGLLDHLGVGEFMAIGLCIGSPFLGKLAQRAPDRLRAAVLSQPAGHNPEFPDFVYEFSLAQWGTNVRAWRPELNEGDVIAYLENLYRNPADFLYSVSRDFIRQCHTPMLIMPDDNPAHPYQVSRDIVDLAPHANATIFPWKDSPEHLEQAIGHVMQFLTSHVPVAPPRIA